jgi:hypothetical protein
LLASLATRIFQEGQQRVLEPVLLAIIAVVAAAVAILVGWAVRRRSRPAPRAAPGPVDPLADADADVLRGDPTALLPGDLTEIRGRTYAVRGTLRFAEGGWGWAEHLLDNAEGVRMWLSVEQDPDVELALWTQVPSATVHPGEPTVDFDGRRYVREEGGRARFTSVGTTGLDPTGVVEYHDYAAPDGPLLSFERFGDAQTWEVARGERLHRAELQIFAQGR